jgi:hypothetical protein
MLVEICARTYVRAEDVQIVDILGDTVRVFVSGRDDPIVMRYGSREAAGRFHAEVVDQLNAALRPR